MLEKIRDIIFDQSLKGKIFRGVAWSFVGTMISKSFLLLSFILVARILSVDDYGKLGIIRSTIITFSFFSVASFGVSATKYLALYINSDKVKAQRILSLTRFSVFICSIIISCLVYYFSQEIAHFFLKDDSLKFGVKIASVAIFFTSMNGLQTGILSGLEKFKYISIINVSNGLLSLPILISLSYFYSLLGAITSLGIIQFLLWFVSLYFVNKSFREEGLSFKIVRFRKELSILKEFTIPSFISGMVVPPVVWVCDLLIINSHNGYHKLGIYVAAYNFSIITITLNTVIGQVLYPFVMKNKSDQTNRLEFFNQVFPFFIGTVLNLPLIIVPELFSLVFGGEYFGKSLNSSIAIIAIFTIIISHRQGIARNFASKNYMWWSVCGNMLWAILAISSVYYFSYLGAEGRALGFLIAFALNTIIFIPLYIKKQLVDKKLLLNKRAGIIWLIIMVSGTLTFTNFETSTKIIICVFLITLTLLVFYNWYRKINTYVI